MPGTTHRGNVYPALDRSGAADVPADIKRLADSLDDAPKYQQGALSARPASGSYTGHLYETTDADFQVLYVWDGTAWREVGGGRLSAIARRTTTLSISAGVATNIALPTQVRDLPADDQFTAGGNLFTCKLAGLYKIAGRALYTNFSAATVQAFLVLAVGTNPASQSASPTDPNRSTGVIRNPVVTGGFPVATDFRVDALWEMAAGEQVGLYAVCSGTLDVAQAELAWVRVAA